jgi:hypothetical protein
MTALTVPERKRLVGICERLASPFDGERAAAALLAHQFLAARGLTFADVLHAEPPPPVVVPAYRTWREAGETCLYDHSQALTEWEARFLQDVLRRGYALTERQAFVMRRICQKTGVPEWCDLP